MSDNSSLTLLADVALHNSNNFSHQRNRREAKSKTLKIIHLNGEDLAELNDLKRLPISFLSKIFVERFEDKKLNHVIYTCKFGVQTCCNTKFKDVKEGRIQRMEHLIQCHLLQHLIKTKSDAMIKIPKKSVEFARIYFRFTKPMPCADLTTTLNYQGNSPLPKGPKNVSDFQDMVCEIEENRDTFHSEPIANNLRQLKRSVVTTNINSSDTFSTNEELTEHVPSKLVTNKQKLVQRKVLPGILMTDHSYAAACTNNIVPFVNSCANSENIAENRSINIDHLYYLNCEPSSELSSFMISDSSYESNSEHKFIFDEFSSIGLEVEIAAEVSKDSSSPAAESVNTLQESHRLISNAPEHKENHSEIKKLKLNNSNLSEMLDIGMKEAKINDEENEVHRIGDQNNNHFYEIIENFKNINDITRQKSNRVSILKSALLKNARIERPVISISNIWNNINVQHL